MRDLSGKAWSLPSSKAQSPSPNPSQNKKDRKKKQPLRGKMCCVDRKALESDLSSQRKTLLKPLFKYTSVHVPSTEDPGNFPNAPGLINLIRSTGEKLKVWDH